MKILLDENIMQKSVSVLEKYGHDVIHVLHRFAPGVSDEDVFQLALREKRALITLNGKDFIIFIPPVTSLKMHYGLIWLRGFQVTNKTYEIIMDTIGFFLKANSNSIMNAYFAVKKKGDVYEIVQRYPRIQALLK